MFLDEKIYYNYLSIKSNILHPLDKFMSQDEMYQVCNKFIFKKRFFSMPFFLCGDSNDIKNINDGFLKIYFDNKYIDKLKILSVSRFNKNKLIYKLFKNKKGHPYIDFILNSKNYIIETDNFANKKNLIKTKKNLVGFATRNIPHIGHEKIILNAIKKKKGLIIINSDIAKNKKINSEKSYDAYKKFIKREKIENKIVLKKIVLPSFLLGYRQAALHAMIGKNLGCDHFIIGRDHSGYKNFYEEFESFKLCKKYQSKIGLKIISSGSPRYCLGCNKVVFREECRCKNKSFDISSSLIRNLKNNKTKKLISNF